MGTSIISLIEDKPGKRQTIVDGFAGVGSLNSFSHSFYNEINYTKLFEYYRKHPIIYAATHKIASGILKNGWAFREVPGVRNKKTNKKILTDWFKSINPYDTFDRLMYNTIINCLIAGHHLIEIDKNNWNLYSDIDMSTMHARLLNAQGVYVDSDQAYWIQQDYTSGIKARKIPMTDLIWFKLPAANSNDSLIPISPIIPLRLDLETDLWGREHNLGGIKNGALINLIINLGKDSDEEEARKMAKYLEDNYISSESENKSNRPFIAYGDVTVTEKEKNKDIDYIKLRNATLEAVSMVYNIPMRLFGVEKSGIGQGKAKSEALVEFYECTIYPLQKEFEETINRQLIRRYYEANTVRGDVIQDYEFIFNRQDLTSIPDTVNVHTKMIHYQMETPLEARKKMSELPDYGYLGKEVTGEYYVNKHLNISTQIDEGITEEDVTEGVGVQMDSADSTNSDSSSDISNIEDTEDLNNA